MPNLTTNYGWNLPLVNNATDADLWGGQLNSNWTSLDGVLPVISSSEYGAIVVQRTDDAGFEMLGQGTTGQFLKSAGADSLPAFDDLTPADTSTAGVVEQATGAEVKAETADKYSDCSDLYYHQGIAKGWVTFNGTGGTGAKSAADSYNITSINKSATGVYTITIPTMSNSNFCVSSGGRRNSGALNDGGIQAFAASSSTIQVNTSDAATGSSDWDIICVSYLGQKA